MAFLIVMSSIQQSNNYNLNCLDTVFLVSTRNRTTLGSALNKNGSNPSVVIIFSVNIVTI